MEWVPIKGYEQVYEINRTGQVRRVETGKILKPGIGKVGYFVVSLWKNNKGKTFTLHRLLGDHFIPNPHHYETINHIDGNKLNNNLSNLEWCSYKMNNQHAWDTGLRKISTKMMAHAKTVSEFARRKNPYGMNRHPVIQCDQYGNEIKEFPNVELAAKELGMNRRTIDRFVKGRTKTCKGFIFKYKEEKQIGNQ